MSEPTTVSGEVANLLSRHQRENLILRETLTGLRGMAEIEAKAGSATWAKAVRAIDAALDGKEWPLV